ncbi:XRE family transcriptional regulator [Psychrobacillus glaciei]|uniref:XRE family transcriptional regulator n=1 Tax=Psychrobacillus glaciei TaxID=2283160 RepID=A0A5J6SQZ3_9BACI|nr:helix-turn-helix transcriptional regulator [Psychrobacillus glaciei]QFF99923.1 XRE family transcriptional regulator [Psychrobacillus glaciei]
MSTFEEIKEDLKETDGELYAKLELVGDLTEERTGRKMSQRELSELSGVAQKTISRIENGVDIPSFSTLYKLAEALGYRLKIVMEKD